ncbi:MAG: HAMP domain-containing histidine kinase [Erysipelotrichaceae bacterium]|nr:HAMP domain-containing histidine kinase [Erysipelotrichaceae bacterium]
MLIFKNKKYLITNILIILIFILLIYISNSLFYQKYINNNNLFLNNVISNILEKYPNITKEEIVSLLNNNKNKNKNILNEYGIYLDNSYVLNNNKLVKYNNISNLALVILLSLSLLIIYLIKLKKVNKELNYILSYLKNINMGIYKLEIDSNDETSFSLLKNELLKTTIMLKEIASINQKDKVLLKKSLEDISHQIKTPLTTITLILDNIDETNYKEKVKDMKRIVVNLNFLINSLLKLARFDANTITFKRDKILVSYLLDKVILNVSILADLKEIEIIKRGDLQSFITGDFNWEEEALTNILKNSLEHSLKNNNIEIIVENNKLYTSITIKDQGVGISEHDLKHIFERFYKCENSTSSSVGIGLSLAKSIIEHDEGSISVISKVGVGTSFIIKYFK